nr:MAG TPA: hypothetical protein [Caudoviricetes sp.]
MIFRSFAKSYFISNDYIRKITIFIIIIYKILSA